MSLTRSAFLYYAFLLVYTVSGVIGTLLSLIYNFHREHVALIFLFGAILSLLLVNDDESPVIETENEDRHALWFFKITLIASITLSVLSVVIFMDSKQNYYLPLSYFLVISLMSLLVLTQILFPNKLPNSWTYFILLKIFVLSSIISASFLFLFPGPYGNDSSYHVGFIRSILTSGTTKRYPGHYQNYPVYHILFVFISLIVGTNNLKIIQFILSSVQVLFLIFVFLLAKKLFGEKVALISTLLVSLSPYVLQPRYMYFPSSFTVIFFILILYLLFYLNIGTLRSSILLIIVFVVTLFSHPLTPAILIFFFFVVFVASNLLKFRKVNISPISILFMVLITLSWWMKPLKHHSNLFSVFILSIKSAFEASDYTAVTRVTLSPLYNRISIMLLDLGFTLLLFGGILGAFYALKKINRVDKKTKPKEKDEKILSINIATLIFVPIPYLLAVMYPQSLPDRWFPFISVLAGIFAGVAVLTIFQKLSEYGLHNSVVLILTIIIFFMITTPIVNPNSQLYSIEFSQRSALTQSEIEAAKFINWLNPEEVHANSKYIHFINRRFLNYSNFICPNDSSTYNRGLVVIRNYDLQKGFTIPLFGAKGKLLEIIRPSKQFYNFLRNSNKIYENGEVRVYFS